MLKRTKVLSGIAMLACGVFLLAGCTPMPKPQTWPLSYQKKAMAAHHWSLIADDVAMQVSDYLVGEGAEVIGDGAVYVDPVNTVFGEAFRDLLITKLVQSKVNVATEAENALTISFKAQTIRHKGPRYWDRYARSNPGVFTAIGTLLRVSRNIHARSMIIPTAVALDAWDGMYTTLPQREIIVTTSIAKDGQYVLRRSDLYYISDADRDHYEPEKVAEKMEVVGE